MLRTLLPWIALSLAACSSGDYDPGEAKETLQAMREYVRRTVPEPGRAATLVGLIDAYEVRLAALNEQLATAIREYRALNADYDATPERLVKAQEDFAAARRKLQVAALDVVQAMKASTTAEEWQGLAKLEEEALRANLRRESSVTRESKP